MYSDHAPILLLPTSQRHRPRKPFRFENWWLMEEDFQQTAQQSWHNSASRSLSHKIRFLAADLKKWRAKKPKTSDQLQSIEDQILSQQTLPPSNQNHTLLHSLNQQHQHLLAREESYHIQRFKKQWAIQGDRNTPFFHLAIIKRHRKNKISHLLKPDGSPSTTPNQISSTLLNYFQSIFSTSSSRPHSPTTNPSHQLPQSHNPHQISQPQPSGLPNPDSTSFTYSTPDLNEIHSIINKMRSNVAPGPDGLNAAFYKASWNWVKQDLFHLVSDFYSSAILPQEINQTFLTLIPKKTNPSIPQDFRPISLYNVVYKLIAKSLADRIKPHLSDYISQAQSAFVAGRHISSNIILTQEIIHSFTLKSWTSQAFLLKIDLAKAFDRLEWNFITTGLNRLGFNSHFINLVSTCISSSSLSILVNDQPTSYFFPQCGLRQGCPLSPYLFVIAINELSLSLQEALTQTNLRGVTLAEGAPPIHSLLFADDLILCGTETLQEAQAIHTILYDFCHQSGQTPNLNKSSIFFSCNVSEQVRNQIRTIFPVGNLIPNTMHLGHPMIFSHKDRNRAYNFIYSKFHAKFGSIKANKLNHAGRLQYIKSVLSSIPVYYMSTVLFSKTFIAKINAIIRKFWWAGIQDENPTNPIAFRSWDDICKPTSQGGLGIRDMELINKILLIHTTWKIVNNINPILSNFLKAKYYPASTF
jgi:hypothetical protein